MNLGSTRGEGGLGLYRHWWSVKNETVEPLEPRHIGAADPKDQVRALTAGTAYASFSKPIFHAWFPPNPGDRRPLQAEWDDLLARFEEEFHLQDQPRIGVLHRLTRDVETAGVERNPDWIDPVTGEPLDTHPHYAWSLVGPDGRAVDHTKNSFFRQERVVACWQFDHGFQLTPLKHEKAVLAWCDEHRPDVAAALRGVQYDGTGPARTALYGSKERARMERSPKVTRKTRHAFNTRKDVWAAWQASDTGVAFEAALAERGYRLVRGTEAMLIVDPAGIEHRATELIGNASAKLGGKRVLAAEVHARLADLIVPDVREARALMRELADIITNTSSSKENDDGRQDGMGDARGEPTGSGDARGDGREGAPEGRGAADPAGASGGLHDTGPGGGASQRAPEGAGGRPPSGDRGAARRPDGGGAAHGRAPVSPGQRVRERLECARSGAVFGRQFRQLTRRVAAPPPEQLVDQLRDRLLAERQRRERKLIGAQEYVAIQRSTYPFEADPDLDAKRARWIAKLVRETYDTGWLSPAAVANIAGVFVDHEQHRVVVTLKTGTQLIDRLDRIEVRGRADDVAVAELVTFVQRKGWDVVDVTGSAEFRRSVAWQLALLDPPVPVSDSPLTEADQRAIDAERARRPKPVGQTRVPPRDGAIYAKDQQG